MKKNIKKAMKEVKKEKGQAYAVIWSQHFDGKEVQYLWNIYDNKWAALNWINLCHARSQHVKEYLKDEKNSYYEFLYQANINQDTEYAYRLTNGSIETWRFVIDK